MTRLPAKLLAKKLRKNRVRSRISGTAERPRLSITISNTHVSAQLIDDEKAHTIASATTIGSKAKGSLSQKAEQIGAQVAKNATKAKIKTVVVDRNGRLYAGRLKALVEAVRKEGIKV